MNRSRPAPPRTQLNAIPEGLLIPAAALDFVFGQKLGEPGVLANKIRQLDSGQRGIVLIANGAGAEEIIAALEKSGMASTVASLRAALEQPDAKPGAQIGIRNTDPTMQ